MPIGNVPYDPNISPSLRDWLEKVRQQVVRPTRPIFIPVSQFGGFSGITVTAIYGTTHFGFESDGNGNPLIQEINSLGVVGARMEATGDACHHLFYVPKDFNVDTNIKFEVVWCTNNSDTSKTATWKVEYVAVGAEETLVAPNSALDEPIAADNVVGTYKVAVTPYGLIFAKTLEHGDFLHLKVSLNAVSGLNPASDEIFLLGILINDEG